MLRSLSCWLYLLCVALSDLHTLSMHQRACRVTSTSNIT